MKNIFDYVSRSRRHREAGGVWRRGIVVPSPRRCSVGARLSTCRPLAEKKKWSRRHRVAPMKVPARENASLPGSNTKNVPAHFTSLNNSLFFFANHPPVKSPFFLFVRLCCNTNPPTIRSQCFVPKTMMAGGGGVLSLSLLTGSDTKNAENTVFIHPYPPVSRYARPKVNPMDVRLIACPAH